ncbi:MAG: DUF2272 domain-containing protein [Candidatus Binatia bacterium]
MPSDFARALAATAVEQYDQFHELSESDPPLATQIKKYWTSLGMGFPGVRTAWSAVFVSSCVKSAGASKSEFVFAAAHSKFVNAAIKNALNRTGVFRAFEVDQVSPQVGDIIQNNRNGKSVTYAFARTHSAYESHSAIVVQVGADHDGHFAMTIGGNESDSIRRKRVALDDEGRIVQRTMNPYICVIQNLK